MNKTAYAPGQSPGAFLYRKCYILVDMEPISIIVKTILGVTVFINASLFIFIFKKRTEGILYVLLLIHLFGILAWGVSIFMLLETASFFWTQCAFASAVVLALYKFLFVLSFPENQLPKESLHYWLAIPTAIALVFSFIDGAFFTKVDIVENYYISIQNGPYAFLYAGFITYLLIYPIFILAKKYKSCRFTGHTQEQIKYLLYGTSLFFLIGLTTNSILPVFFDIYFFNGLGPSFSLIFASFIIYIISRHNFLEFKVALQRGFIYSVLLFCIVTFYLATVTFFGMFVHQVTQTAILWSAGISTIVGIFGVPYIDRFLRKKTDSLFFKNRYNYADALYTLSEKIGKYVLFEDIKKQTEETLSDILKNTSVVTELVRKENEQYVIDQIGSNTDTATLIIPILLQNRLIGTIFLGEKKSGDPYTQEDMVLIKTFSNQIAVAFEKARLYQEVQEYSQELEHKVAARTAEIKKLQDEQTHMMLDISHKLQNPLTIVKAEIGLLKKQVPEKIELLSFEKTIDDISTFIYDLLHLARIDVVHTNEPKEFLDLSKHLNELLEYFTLNAEHSQIILTHNITPDIRFNCHKAKITELVTNLVSNAVKYSDQKKARHQRTIEVTLSKDKTHIILKVADTGIGIAQSELPYIFERFYRCTDDKEGAAIGGTGLGLAICKKITEIHNGTIEVESAVTVGTTFTVHMPVL